MFDLENITRASSVEEAVHLLLENPGSRLIAGGTDVLIKLRHGKKEFANLVDIHGLHELNFIRLDEEENIHIGSGTTFTQIIESELIREHIPVLANGAASVGGPQVRNVATLGGNICNGVTSADSAPPLFVLNAVLSIQGKDGVRESTMADFYLGPGKVDLHKGEVLRSFTIPAREYQGLSGYYYKYAMREAMDIATIGCGVGLKVADGVVQDYRLSFGVAGPVPIRCPQTEAMVVGRRIAEELVEEIKARVIADVKPRTSWRASREFRLQIITELAGRATKEALRQAGGLSDDV